MLPDPPFTFTVLLLLVAFIVGARTVFALEWIGRVAARVRAAESSLEGRSGTLARSLADTRERLATVDAYVEHALWTLPRVDSRLDALTDQVRERRAEVEGLRTGALAGTASGLARTRAKAQLVLKVIKLRRTMLG